MRPARVDLSDDEESAPKDVVRRRSSRDFDEKESAQFREPKSNVFKPRMVASKENLFDDGPKASTSKSWAEKKPSRLQSGKENERQPPLSKWNEAKRTDPCDSSQRSADSSDNTDGQDVNSDMDERVDREDEDNDEDFDIIKNPKYTDTMPSAFSKFSSSAEAKGVTLMRKSSRYDEEAVENEAAQRKEFEKYWEDAVDTNSEDSGNVEPQVSIPYVLRAHARGSRTEHVQCVILRDRSSIQSKMYPTYELYLEESKKKLIVATKMNLNRTSNYHLFDMTRGQAGKLSKKSGNYLGKLRAKNMNRTEYSLVTHSSEREELAGIGFDRLGLVNQLKEGSQPRKMTVMVPHLDSNKIPIANKIKENGEGSIIDHLRSTTKSNKFLSFESKDPVYENGNYRLNFNGRVSVPSVKNFQLVPKDNPENIVCQFGKIGEDRFHLDFKSPLNAFQAFALALSQFNL